MFEVDFFLHYLSKVLLLTTGTGLSDTSVSDKRHTGVYHRRFSNTNKLITVVYVVYVGKWYIYPFS